MTDEQPSRKIPDAPRLVAIGVLLAFAAALLLSILYGAPRRLPSVALGAPLVLELERAVLGTALIAAVLVVALNLAREGLPSKLSTSGVEWPGVGGADRQVLDPLLQATREARDAIDQLSALAASQTPSPESADRLAAVNENVERMDSALDEAAAREAMADALAALPERERMVVALSYYEGLTDDEIAKILRVTTGSVRALRAKAIARLRGKLGDDPRLKDFFDR